MTRRDLVGILILSLAIAGLACTRSPRETDRALALAMATASDAAPAGATAAATPMTAASVGDVAPDFALAASDGSSFRLSERRGRPLVLVFFRGTW